MAAALPMFAATHVASADWSNAGGDAGRNGLIGNAGPDAPLILWSLGKPSIIAWQPVIDAGRVFAVRQTGFPPEPASDKSPVVAMDLATGGELWSRNIPANAGDWTTWIAGARDGKVYAGRSGNGASVAAKLYALNALNGTTVWTSVDTITAGAYDGVVFAPNGDLIIASFTSIKRIRAIDGTTAWTTPRVGSVSGNCGAAVGRGGAYVVDAVVGGHAVKKFDLATGAFQYASPVMSGFTIQNSPMVGPDGTIYVSRTQNNVSTDFFYAFLDTGTSLNIKWSVPARWTTSSEFGVGPDNTVYMLAPGNVVRRLDPITGGTLNSSAPLAVDSPSGNLTPRLAVDSLGRVFVSNGQFATGRFYSYNADLTDRWSVAVPNINIGAPAIGSDGTLVVCGVGTNIVAYRTKPLPPTCAPDIAPPPLGNGIVNIDDLLAVINAWGATSGPADVNDDGIVNIDDLLAVINSWGACP